MRWKPNGTLLGELDSPSSEQQAVETSEGDNFAGKPILCSGQQWRRVIYEIQLGGMGLMGCFITGHHSFLVWRVPVRSLGRQVGELSFDTLGKWNVRQTLLMVSEISGQI
jgi:hypothetical protein